ncbi:unnamed protein product [Ranitomeya imitator]|uniref:Reverse transcriptase domain-containing protein n=1 Tax=Ranitomeya imitator TaxID=111125 RepID=A0ABN9LRS5_9NEOB|nr:unnamed protein product [Ranitomeya imitator]
MMSSDLSTLSLRKREEKEDMADGTLLDSGQQRGRSECHHHILLWHQRPHPILDLLIHFQPHIQRLPLPLYLLIPPSLCWSPPTHCSRTPTLLNLYTWLGTTHKVPWIPVHLYADDTQIYLSGPDVTALLSRIPECLSAISSFFSSRFLKLNVDKSERIIFPPSHRSSLPDLSIAINDIMLSPVPEVRCLGVIVDSAMSFKPHIHALSTSCRLQLKNLRFPQPFQNRERFEKLKAELLECNAKLQSAKCQQYREIEPLQKFVEITREDNRKLAQTLNLTLQRNSTLQNLVNELQKELQNKELQEKQLILNQAKAAEDYSLKEKLLGEQLVSLQNKHRVESKEAKKAVRKELTELKKALDSVTAKSTELSRTNRELRNRESMLEKETLHQKDLIHNLKIQLKSHIESQGVRKQSERIQDLEAELKRMKNMKESYEKNNNEQCKRIQEFMTEVDHMRKEINAAASQDAKEPNVQSQLEEEVTYRQKLEQRCKELESRVQKLQQVKSDTEISLRAANEGSEQYCTICGNKHTSVCDMLKVCANWWRMRAEASRDTETECARETAPPTNQSCVRRTIQEALEKIALDYDFEAFLTIFEKTRTGHMRNPREETNPTKNINSRQGLKPRAGLNNKPRQGD